MSVRIKNQRDFWSAVLFAVVALVFLWQSAGLTLGTADRMGPAYMPRMLCFMMLAVAATLFVKSFRGPSDDTFKLSLRPMLVIPLALVVFALALRPLGLVITIWLAVGVAAFSDRDTRPLEIVLIAIFLSIFSVATFVYGLKLNFPIWPGVF